MSETAEARAKRYGFEIASADFDTGIVTLVHKGHRFQGTREQADDLLDIVGRLVNDDVETGE